MAAQSGRDMRWSREGVPIVGARSDAITINAEPVNITDKDDDGWNTYRADVASRSISASISGVTKADTLADAILGDATLLLAECDLEIGGIYVMTGDFHLSNVTLTGEQTDAVTFDAEMQGSGTFVQSIGPYNTTPASISGTVTVGQVLTATNGTWAGDATISYTRPWQRSLDGSIWTNVGVAAGTYTLVSGDIGYMIRKLEIATNSVGSAETGSNVLGPVTA